MPGAGAAGLFVELRTVNDIRKRLAAWRAAGRPGVSRATSELLAWWERPDREDTRRLFFAQREAAETLIFLREARADFRQGIVIPRDEPDAAAKAKGFAGFERVACKMATGTGKTTVMGMHVAWSVLNKLDRPNDKRFSDAVLVVCPNVTIRDRLRELDPQAGDASVYRTRDLVPPHQMPRLAQGRVLVTNWHVFEPQGVSAGGESGKVLRSGVKVGTQETIKIGTENTTKRGVRFLTLETFERQVSQGLLTVLDEVRDRSGALTAVKVRSRRYVESDMAMVNRLLVRAMGGKRNILVLNDEAHHAYRIRPAQDEDDDNLIGDDDGADEFFRGATVWVEGLDRIHKLRGINKCVDLSATPYYLGRVGQEAGRPFPWVVSDFGLTDAIESGLVKIPQLAVRDGSGKAVPGYFNVWEWVLGQMTPAERGGNRASPKPEAVLKYAHTPVAMLAAEWQRTFAAWGGERAERPPVFIFVCKNVAVAKAVFEWVAEGKQPGGVPPLKVEAFRNRPGEPPVSIRVDTKVVSETDTAGAKADEMRWLRFTLDTVGRRAWPTDMTGRPLYPEGFEELATKLKRPTHPPGRGVRCIVSVAMLPEGWDCNTVTHVVGLRPFQSQLLCEQVVGRALRRASYDVGDNGLLTEEVAKVFGVPFTQMPTKANPGGPPPPQSPRHLVRALPGKADYEIRFPRVEGYTQAVRNRVTVDWDALPPLGLNPLRIPPEVELKASLADNTGRPSLSGPGRLESVTLNPWRRERRVQELAFDLARAVTVYYVRQPTCELPAHVLFPQLLSITRRYLAEKVRPVPPAEPVDVFLSPYYGWVVERLAQAVRPDAASGEAPEVPVYETSREPGTTADVSFWTGRDVREAIRTHLNYVVADTQVWEQSATYFIDTHPRTAAFVKNAGLGFGIPYFHDGQDHEYIPDFIIRLEMSNNFHLILEVKGYDPLTEVKQAAALRWCAAVNAEGSYGRWGYVVVKNVSEIQGVLAVAGRSISRPH